MMSALSQKAESVWEAARIFIEKLSALENAVDHQKYTACAGVAIVHQKYPFYKAYELSEMLCSNAKRFLASYDDRIKDSEPRAVRLTGISNSVRSSMILLRCARNMRQGWRNPGVKTLYAVCRTELWKLEKVRRYRSFKKLLSMLLDKKEVYARGKIKELRGVLKEGEKATGILSSVFSYGYFKSGYF